MRKGKKLVAGMLSVLLAAMPTIPIFAEDAMTTVSMETEKDYIVVLREGESAQSMISLLDGVLPAERMSAETSEELAERNMLVLSLSPAEVLQLVRDERVAFVEEDVIVQAMTNGDSTQESPTESVQAEYEWNLAAVHATPEELSQYAVDESVIKVAVLDSGICVIEDIEVEEYVNLAPREEEIPAYFTDETGHGTAVAGVIAAKNDAEGIVGIAPNASVYSVRVFDQVNEAPLSRIIEGIYWAVDHDIDILNMSFGTSVNSQALHLAIQDADEAGILMVAAAGNNGQVEYPAAYNEVVAVGAVDYTGNRAPFSAVGESLELMAPGVCVLSDSFYGGVMAVDGTSVAAPHVAGAAALLWAKNPAKSSDFIRQLLNASANRSQGADAREYGNGLLDVKHAFEIYDAFAASYVPGVYEYAGIAENTAEYVESDAPAYAVGSWSSSGHNNSIQSGSTVDSSLYSSKNIKVMQWISATVDGIPFNATGNVANLHGGMCYGKKADQKMDNYVDDLLLLYEVAVALKEMNSSSSVAAQEAVVDEVASKRSGTPREHHATFLGQVKALLSYTDTAGYAVPYTQSELMTPQVNTFKILGAALHLAGDTYAHRTLVPSTATSSSGTANSFDRSDFGAETGTLCPVSILEETGYNRHNGDSSSLCHHDTWECFDLAVRNMFVEFKEIKIWTGVPNSRYEDNPNFYSERFSIGTNYTVRYIMKKYKEGAVTLDSNVFLPGANGYIYNLKLNNLKGCYQDVGFPWTNGWSAYTTEDIR